MLHYIILNAYNYNLSLYDIPIQAGTIKTANPLHSGQKYKTIVIVWQNPDSDSAENSLSQSHISRLDSRKHHPIVI